ncbi:MAG: InlB B-repeat-containing protein, partial [Synergistaceae bacterium]|nr:InlB B-repeat-containing protein [Synergistaceae bacterium]
IGGDPDLEKIKSSLGGRDYERYDMLGDLGNSAKDIQYFVTVVYWTVSFDSKGGTSVSPTTGVVSGTTISKPTDPTHQEGYIFDGWYKDADYGTEWNFDTDTVTSDIILYAKWRPDTTPLIELLDATGDGSTGVTSTAITLTFDKGVTGLTADKITITNDTGSVVKGTILTDLGTTRWKINLASVTKEGDVKVLVANFGSYVFTGSPKTAKIYKTAGTFTVTFDSQGGTSVSPTTGVVSGTTISKPTDPTQEGYIFDGWYKDVAYGTKWDFNSDMVTANITLYAKWTQVPPPDPTSLPIELLNATGDGSTGVASTAITLTFDKEVTGLTADKITITNGTGSAEKGTSLTGLGTTWMIDLASVTKEGEVYVSITDFGSYVFTGLPKTATVYNEDNYSSGGGGCNAGFGVLLLVLAGLTLKRQKNSLSRDDRPSNDGAMLIK